MSFEIEIHKITIPTGKRTVRSTIPPNLMGRSTVLAEAISGLDAVWSMYREVQGSIRPQVQPF